MTLPAVAAGEVPEDAVLLDVREADEWAAGHAPDAVHLPMSQLQARAAEIPETPDGSPLVVVCRVGGRSAQVVAWLLHHGRDAVNLDGGMLAWAAAGRPVRTDAGDGIVL